MSDHQHRLSSGQFAERLLDQGFILRIRKCGGLVHDDDRSVLQDCAGQSDSLGFPSGEIDAFGSHYRIQPLGQLLQDIRTLSGPGCRFHFFPARIRPRHTDIFQETHLKQLRVLKDKRHPAHQIAALHLPHIHSADPDASALRIPETGNQRGRRGFSSAGRPHQAHNRTLFYPETHIRKRRPLRAGIAERHMVKHHFRSMGLSGTLCLGKRLLLQDLIQLHHSLICFHHRLGRIHDPVDHTSAGRSEQRIEYKIRQHFPAVSSGSQQKRRRDQQSETAVDAGQKRGLSVPAAHGVLAGQITVRLDRRVECLERIHRLLKYFHHRDTADIFHRFSAHLLDLSLVTVKKSRVLPAHHAHHTHHGQHHGQQAQKAHPPVKDKKQDNGRRRSDHRRRQIRQLMRQQILRQRRVVIDNLPQPPGLVSGKKSKRQVHHMFRSCAADIAGCTERRDMRAHQCREIHHNIRDREPHGHPSPADYSLDSAHIRVGRQYAARHQPYADIGRQSQHRRDAGQRASQYGELLMSFGIAQQL